MPLSRIMGYVISRLLFLIRSLNSLEIPSAFKAEWNLPDDLPAMPVSLASTPNYIVFGNMQRGTAGKTLFIASILPHNSKLVFLGFSRGRS